MKFSQLFLVLSLGVISVYTFYTYTYGLDESGLTAQALLSQPNPGLTADSMVSLNKQRRI